MGKIRIALVLSDYLFPFGITMWHYLKPIVVCVIDISVVISLLLGELTNVPLQ